MEKKFEKQSPTNATLTISLSEPDYAPLVDKKIKEYSRTANIKGFRPGKVPAGYIKKLYGKSLLVDEVINLVSREVTQYIRENELPVVGDPMPDDASKNIDWDNDKDYTFNYEVGLASDFDADTDKIPAVKYYEIEPSDERVNEAIEDLQKRFGKEEEMEVSEMGDLLFGKLTQESSDFSFDSGIPTDKVNPEIADKFVGLKIGDSVTFDIQSLFPTERELGFATGKSDEDAAALSGDFTFTVERILRSVPAELNQEFFDKVLGEDKADSEESFRQEVKSIIKENYVRESDALFGLDIENALLDNIAIDLPDDFLKRWLFAVNEGKFTPEQIENDYDAFARNLRLDLIRSEIATKNELKVEYNDVLEVVKNEIRGYFGGGNFAGMEDFVDKMAREQLQKNQDSFQQYFNRAFNGKVMNYLQDTINKDIQTVSVDEFNDVAKQKYGNPEEEISAE